MTDPRQHRHHDVVSCMSKLTWEQSAVLGSMARSAAAWVLAYLTFKGGLWLWPWLFFSVPAFVLAATFALAALMHFVSVVFVFRESE